MAQTQQLESVFLETSGFYIFRKDAYFENNTRITGKPFFVEVDYKESIDIDYPSDFRLAQQLVEFDTNLANSDFDEYFLNVVNLFQRNGNVRHVSFDLDGVLIDSLELMKESWSYALAELEINVEFQSYKQHIGLPFLEILRALDIGKKYHDEIATRYNSYSAANVGRVKLYEDIGYELDNLKREGIKLSIITSKTRKRTSEIVDHFFGASLFDLIICPEDVPSGRGKPNPDPLLYACVKLGVDPVNTIYVGDMEPDRECANRAGASFVFANWGYGNLDSSKEVWFNGISDLCSYLLSD
jgi:HAD superfamily hydrolase (TIGR01549 family)